MRENSVLHHLIYLFYKNSTRQYQNRDNAMSSRTGGHRTWCHNTGSNFIGLEERGPPPSHSLHAGPSDVFDQFSQVESVLVLQWIREALKKKV